MRRPSEAIVQILILLFIILIIIIIAVSFSLALPVGISVDANSTQGGPIASAGQSNAEGGTITTLLVNASMQSNSWKGYVGNVTGHLALRDSSNFSLYDWNLATISGEVYTSRQSSIDWGKINCSNTTLDVAEDAALGIPSSNIDTINKTFVSTIHKTLTIGSISIQNSTCPALTTYINSTAQVASEQAKFQEILLFDTTSLVYATIIEQNAVGYNNQTFDFQMMVPDSYSETTQTTYYFWAELV